MAENEKKPQTSLMKFGIGIVVMALVLCALMNTVLKDWVVIGFGIRVFGILRNVGFVVLALGLLVALIGAIPFYRELASERYAQQRATAAHRQQSQILSDYAKDSTNPELTRKRLRQLQQEMPSIDQLVERCLAQMDRMDKMQARQNVLIETNDAQYLRKTVEVFDKVERRLCQNFRNVINLCIATDLLDDEDERKINRHLADNDTKLNNAQELLDASVDWINQYNTDSASDRSEVENWIAVIRDSLKED